MWWASTTRLGRLEPPMEGRFDGGHGVFHGKEVIARQAVDVRFEWHAMGTASARWEQAFSFDDGRTWTANRVMDLERAGEADPASMRPQTATPGCVLGVE